MDSGKRIRVPAQDGAILAVPPLDSVGDILTLNRERLEAVGDRLVLVGRSLSDLRRQAREAVFVPPHPNPPPQGGREKETPSPLVGEGWGGGGVVPGLRQNDVLFVAGHQPELFHPGVWVKNFALFGLARKYNAATLNLVVDDDTIKTTALRVPAPPHIRRVLFDRWTGATPYEERTIVDRSLFASFAERVEDLTRQWPYEPLLPAFWTEVLRQSEHTANLGECFAAARRTFEQSWGCHNQEMTLSSLCDSVPFAYFACHLFVNLPHFHSLYNTILADYRRRHGIRDRQRPVPDLAADGDWLEAPFWIWRTGASRRQRLFVRRNRNQLELRGGEVHLNLHSEPQVAWQELRSQGLKIRTRALTTTLYARLFLADVFLHGIGGGIYDELTDELMRRFYECEPPEFLVLSATRLLPLPRTPVTENDCRRLRHELRDLQHNPQRYLDDSSTDEQLSGLIRRKHEWIARQPTTSTDRRERFRTLRILTEELRRPLHSRADQLRRQLRDCEQELRSNAVLGRRDYSFCLFPESILRPFCTQFLQG